MKRIRRLAIKSGVGKHLFSKKFCTAKAVQNLSVLSIVIMVIIMIIMIVMIVIIGAMLIIDEKLGGELEE